MRVCLLSNFGIYHRCLVICFESPDRIFPTVPPIQSCRSAPSGKLAGCRSSRHVNRTMHPNRLPRVQRAFRSLDALPCLSLSGAPSPTRLHAQRIWIELLPRLPFSLLSFFLSASHCLCFFSTLSVPQDFLTNSVRFHSLLSTAEPSFARTLPCSLQRNNRNEGPRGWFG